MSAQSVIVWSELWNDGRKPKARFGPATVLKREGRNNVLSSYAYASTHGIGYHLAYLGADFPDVPPGDATAQFNTGYMRDVFARGDAQGRTASPW